MCSSENPESTPLALPPPQFPDGAEQPAASPPPASAVAPERVDAPDRFERRAQAVRDALRALLRDYALHHLGDGGAAASPFPVALRLNVEPGRSWDVRFMPPLQDQVHAQMEDALARRGVYRPGHVFCFRCASADCDHSSPPDALAVFRGYASTGLPLWSDLVQVFIENRDERASDLYNEPPAILAAVQLGRDLKRDQLTSFGRDSKTYAILGQVAAGYFLLPPRLSREVPSRRLAVTFQAVETRGVDGRARLRINALAGSLGPDEWDEFRASEAGGPLNRALSEATENLNALEQQVQIARAAGRPAELREHLQSIPRILRALARSIEIRSRQGRRRTRHAERHSRQERPIHKAFDDARGAADADLLHDERRSTWIVLGKQGRVHAFSKEGRHVTSFVVTPGSAEFRMRTGRWRAMQPEEKARFRAALATVAGAALSADTAG